MANFNDHFPLATRQASHVAVTATGNGNNTIIAGVANCKIRILSGFLQFANANGGYVIFKSGTALGGTPIGSAQSLAKGDQLNLAPCEWGHFDTATGEEFVIAIPDDGELYGWLNYILVPST